MTLSGILDTAIGLVFIYFLLSVIASGIQEVVAGIFAWRGTYLARGVDVILDNDSSAAFRWAGIGEWLLAHFTNKPLPTAADRLAATVASQGGQATPAQQTLQQVLSVPMHPLMKGTPSAVPSYVPARNFSLALLETLRDGSKAPLFSQAERTISALPDGDLKTTLSAFLESAGGDLDAFRAQLEQWFDDAMDRVAGVYKRMSQYAMVVLGVLIAVALNLDSIRVARTLWETPAFRAAVVAGATQAAQKQPSPATSNAPDIGQIMKDVAGSYRNLEATNLPFGWTAESGSGDGAPTTVGGWAITAAAVGLGAPFWFGLLQNLVNMRNAGPKPQSANNGDGSG